MTALRLFLVGLAVYLAASYGGIRAADGEVVYRTAEALAHEGSFAVEESLPWKGFGLARGTDRAGAITDPDYNSLMFCPTPATLARGDSYFRDFELFILNFGLSVTDAFDLSIGTLFPVSSDVMMVSVGGKLRLLDRSESPLGLALVGSYTSLEEIQFGGVGFVAGIGNKRNSLNLSVSRTFDDDGDTETVILAGADYQGTRRTKIFLEYMSTASLLEDENDDDFHGFLNLGLRIFGARHSFSLSGFRPLDNDSDSLLGFPMIMYSYHW